MVQKTYTVAIQINNLEEIVKKHIVELKGTIISCESSVIKWRYVYGKQNLECTTSIHRNEIITEAQNLGNISVGEGIVVNRFFNSLSEKISIQQRVSINHRVSYHKNAKRNSDQNNEKWTIDSTEKIVLIVVSVILFLVFTYDDSKTFEEQESTNSYITQDGFKASYNEESMKTLVKCAVRKDYDCIDFLLATSEVFDLPSGVQAYIIESEFNGKVKIRLKGQTEEIWTFIEAIKSR